jgi:hypothetical protein
MKRSEEKRKKAERRRKKAEKEQLEEQKRIEAMQQLEEKRRKEEAKKKEVKERREEEKRRIEEEARRIRKKEVDAETAKAKKEREELIRNKEVKARLSAEEYNQFLVRERERELMLMEEARKQLCRKSEETDRAREAKAKKDWEDLQERETAEGIPAGTPAFRYRSIKADNSREMLVGLGNLRDQLKKAPLERRNWFDSDLCILEPTNSMQLAAFDQLRLTGLLCSRFSTSVRKGRRFFALAGDDEELPNGREDRRRDASRRQRQQLPASPAVPAPDGGSRAGADAADDPLAVPGPSGMRQRQENESPSGQVRESAAVVSAEEPAVVQGQPVLVGEPAAAQGKSWVMNPAISPKVIVNMTSEGSAVKAAAEAAAPQEGESGESLPGLESPSVARRAAEGRARAGDGGQGKEESECWRDWRVPEEEEILASWTK